MLLLLVLLTVCGPAVCRRGRHGLLTPPHLPEHAQLPPDQWFTQKLDHSQPSDTRYWQQRYFTNATFHRRGGPVFLMIGGEGEASPVWMVTGQWMEYARQHGALCFLLEHRFYGKSRPTEDMSVKNLRYLSSEQALADLATFSVAMTTAHNLSADTRWVAFGGSYPGSLAAWYRLKYPHLVHASVSTSAPLHAKANFYEFLAVVSDAVKTLSGPPCYNSIALAFQQVKNMLADGAAWPQLSKLFRLCSPLDGNNQNDVASLVSSLADLFEGTVQYNRDNRGFEGAPDANVTVSTLCDLMTGPGLPLEALARVNTLLLNTRGDKCLDYTYRSAMQKLRQESFDSNDNTGARQWTYQTCSEFGWYQTSDLPHQPFGHLFPLQFSVQQCQDAFGRKFDRGFIERAVAATNTRYGGRHIRARRIVFLNGSIDPWHAMGLVATRRKHQPVIYIEGTAHCANMYPARAEDPPQLTAARAQVGRLLASWLRERPHRGATAA